MNTSYFYNNIEPNNSRQVRPTESLIDKRDFRRNNISTTNAKKTDNYARKTSASPSSVAAAKTKSFADIIKSFAVIVSSLMIGVVGINILPQQPSNVKFEYLEAYDTGVFYEVVLDEYEEGLKVVIKNDFITWEDPIYEQMWSGYFEGLEPNLYYTISIVKGSTTLVQERIFTHYYEKESPEEYEEEPIEVEPIEEDPTSGPNIADDNPEEEPVTEPNISNGDPEESGDEMSGYIG